MYYWDMLAEEILMAQNFKPTSLTIDGVVIERLPVTEAGCIFYNRFNSVETEIPFNTDWKNGTGYYDGALDIPMVQGNVVKSYDPTSDRLLVIIGCAGGNIVVHERYSGGNTAGVFVKTSENRLLDMVGIPSGAIGLQSMIRLLGDWSIDNNIGVKMGELAKEFELM
jgi:hypothetical protein